jgi:4-hydroxy 2-oxovalerate aldolase
MANFARGRVELMSIILLDCTLRDGGYYNNWDFDPELVDDYLQAMADLEVDFVEIGFRSLKNDRFKGAFAYTTDTFLRTLRIPIALKARLGVMLNGAELCPSSSDDATLEEKLAKLFAPAHESPVSLVRIACHLGEFVQCLPAAHWLSRAGYKVGFNLMQVATAGHDEIVSLVKIAQQYPLDVLYFADSLGSLEPDQTADLVKIFRSGWHGALGIHTHDNMGNAVANSLKAIEAGVTWVDSTVTGMGRGPGNAQTEFMALALAHKRSPAGQMTRLLELVNHRFKPLQASYGWGANPFYYLAGQYRIHPSYIQEMLADTRYDVSDILSVINHLKAHSGDRFSRGMLLAALNSYKGAQTGSWCPADLLEGRPVLVVGPGQTVRRHREALECWIQQQKPVVIALNTCAQLPDDLIDLRAACHPVRLMADLDKYADLPQPLITPLNALSSDEAQELTAASRIHNYGITTEAGNFSANGNYCVLPAPLVFGYVLAVVLAGKAQAVYLAGFDGYGSGDPRTHEVQSLINLYREQPAAPALISLTPTCYEISTRSVYAG